MEPIIQIRDLRKFFGKKQALYGINLDIMPGQIIGYIGPNGAGKSTTVRILAGLDERFEGTVTIKGIDVKENPLAVKRIIGYIPELADLYDVLAPMEFLMLIGRLHDLEDQQIEERATRMLDFLGLKDQLHHRMDTFSKGMRQKVLLVSGLLHNPEIIFMDEPLSGLDANAVILVKEIILRLVEQGKTVIYCSHNMDTVEKISDRIILIAEGKVVADGTFQELKRNEGDTLEKLFSQLTGQPDFDQLAEGFTQTFNP
ncbi:ABC transporter ATP-binding protein [Haliscomenobacter hydrossis]|uniref:Fe(3+)-transporting ATPase n=1 Tax=Haliscomenobacter hydrossis (strain ATCC 27775 / DSM 1100 / LMG 10767 / O) TaxID=760192 RepID=F4L578_HALH1|nr:ABC transporter ATP-binding protein [Haliscomenobacter hydrossis]AEE49758.1 Fe(3+)-transporting ATPase [Haliscomenobacter hydrossis DSM 1100]